MKQITHISRAEKEFVEREVDILQNLEHSNIVKLLQLVPGENHSSLIFEFCFINLSQWITGFFVLCGNALPEFQHKHILKQLLAGVKYLHEENIMHRALRPVNLLLERNGDLKIAGFGSARRVGRGLEALYTDSLGNPSYSAIEILLGHHSFFVISTYS